MGSMGTKVLNQGELVRNVPDSEDERLLLLRDATIDLRRVANQGVVYKGFAVLE
jgi:hypothetical protein